MDGTGRTGGDLGGAKLPSSSSKHENIARTNRLVLPVENMRSMIKYDNSQKTSLHFISF